MATSILNCLREVVSTSDGLAFVTVSTAVSTGLFLAIIVLYRRFLSPLAVIKGPFLASVSKLWFARHVIRGDLHQLLPQLHKKYGQKNEFSAGINVNVLMAIKEVSSAFFRTRSRSRIRML